MNTNRINETSEQQLSTAISTHVLRGLPELQELVWDDEIAKQLRTGLQEHGESFFALALAMANEAIPRGPDELEDLWTRFYINTYNTRREALELLLEHFDFLPPFDEIVADVSPAFRGLLVLDEERAAAELDNHVFLVEGIEGIHAFLRYPEKPDNE